MVTGPLVVPAAVGEHELQQVVVAAAEQGRAQCRGESEFVGGIVDRTQDRDKVDKFVGHVRIEARLDAVGHSGLAECLGERSDRALASDQDGDIARTAGHFPRQVRATRRVLFFPDNGPTLSECGSHRRHDVCGLANGDVRLTVVGVGAEQADGGADVDPLADRCQGLVLGLGVFLVANELAEDSVHPVDDRCRSPEVVLEAERVLAERRPGAQIEGDVSSSEAVDGLLGVADEKERAVDRS